MASMDTLSDVLDHLVAEGWTLQLEAGDGMVRCVSCEIAAAPEEVVVDRIERFEGPSDPADAAAIYALTLPCGCRGTLVTGYGADVPGHVARVVRALRSERRFE